MILDSRLPTVFFAGDGVEIAGHITDGKKNVILYIAQKDGSEVIKKMLIPVDNSGRFHDAVILPKGIGQYIFIIASGNSFSTDTFATIEIIDRESLVYPELPILHSRISPRIVTV